jgi:hypothetical protein
MHTQVFQHMRIDTKGEISITRRIRGIHVTSIDLQEYPRSSCKAPVTKLHQRPQTRNKKYQHTFSLAAVKSILVTLIRRSLSANSPASVQTALISAPDISSLAMMNSSRSTSSLRLIRDVCSLQRTNQSSRIDNGRTFGNSPEDMSLCLDIW